MNKWLIMVNATKYNLFGAVRKYGNAIPWFFDGTKGAAVGDRVFFYFTASNPSDDDEGYGADILESLYKRVVFEGVITEVGADSHKADIDAEYWDKKQAEDMKSKCKELVLIQIVKPRYDENITSKEFDNIWLKNQTTFVVKIENMDL